MQAPAQQFFYKPMVAGGAKTAVLAMNSDAQTETLTVNFKDIPGLACTTCHVRDIWGHKDLGTFTDSWSGPVESHDCAFLVVTP